jgi:hypothetical protein
MREIDMAATLDRVFTSAASEDSRRRQQEAALKTFLAGPAFATVALLKNINDASNALGKAQGIFGRWGEEGSKYYMRLRDGAERRGEDGSHVEKKMILDQGHLGRGIAFTFRDDGTVKIEQQETNMKLVSDGSRYGAREVTTGAEVYDGPFDAAIASEQIGVYLGIALEEKQRAKLQAAVANLTPVSGSSPRPDIT